MDAGFGTNAKQRPDMVKSPREKPCTLTGGHGNSSEALFRLVFFCAMTAPVGIIHRALTQIICFLVHPRIILKMPAAKVPLKTKLKTLVRFSKVRLIQALNLPKIRFAKSAALNASKDLALSASGKCLVYLME